MISRYDNIHNGDLVVVNKGGNDKNIQGTWIHRKLIIAFARWLSPDFAVWCDETIEDILSQRFAPKISLKEKLELEFVGVKNTIEILRPSEASKIKMVETIHKKFDLETSYLPEYSDENHTYSAKALLEKFEIKISVQQFNKEMISAGFLETKTRKSSKYRTEKDVDGKEVKIPILKEFKSLTEKGLKFGKNLISPKNQLESQPHYFESKFSELLNILGLKQV
ncbi:KilA-N domain-containing protein [Thiovulum sp. ES]|nr:KilA-N domain-containing protein [Thiovulum sp. ES]